MFNLFKKKPERPELTDTELIAASSFDRSEFKIYKLGNDQYTYAVPSLMDPDRWLVVKAAKEQVENLMNDREGIDLKNFFYSVKSIELKGAQK